MISYFVPERDGIRWTVRNGQSHRDDVELSAFLTSFTVGYGVNDDGTLFLSRYCVFPMLRTIPNDTHASLRKTYDPEAYPVFLADGQPQTERAISFFFNGILRAESESERLRIVREFYPARESFACIEEVTVENKTDFLLTFSLSTPSVVRESQKRGTKGIYLLEVCHNGETTVLQPGEKTVLYVRSTARIAHQPIPAPDGAAEKQARLARIRQLCDTVVLKSGNSDLDRMFRFACLHSGESIFHTLTGDRHCPCGRNFYAATWCNDQVEYAGPWFALTGDEISVNASKNAYNDYIPFMSDSFDPIPSSVISEGLDIWEGAGDRGDAAMYLFGCSLFVLTLNRPETTDAYLPALRWCAEFLQRKTLPEGVIFSDSDELEGRCPTDGYANLATSCLTYGGDLLAAGLFDSADPSYAKTLRDRAARLRDAIESYFGETLHGFRCYRYTKGGHDTLRSWICLPLVAEIFDRAEGTMDALYSPYLWTENGMLTCERGPENRNDTAWDRSTLFAFKGGFLSGRTEETWTKLKAYLSARLYGNRVPYPVEAYPENGMRHLSAESALFNRIIVEGMLGYRPLGDGCYRLFPHLPAELSDLSLRGLFLSGKRVDVVFRDGVFTVSVSGKTVARGRNVVPLFFKI